MKVNYTIVSFVGVLLILAVFFIAFERRKPKAREIIPIAVMCAVASVGRVVFNFIPQVQPVTVIVIIMGACFGKQAGFMTGALSALVSNMILGQGFWTPFQMLAWGVVGLIGGVLADVKLSKNMVVMCIYAFVSALIYGLITDFWTIAFMAGENLTWSIVLSVYSAGLVFNIIHGIGNVVFMIVLYKILMEKFDRIGEKYGLGS
ncbi:MAG TPA: ECF transporter S component [Clostridiales bacterium]|nr:ECF transporter S component [Clostridiales bacterium]